MNIVASTSLLVPPAPDTRIYQHVSPSTAGWKGLHVQGIRLRGGEAHAHDTAGNECVLVVLGGTCAVDSTRGSWERVGRRPTVFEGMPHALYLPRQTRLTIRATSAELDIALGWCATDQDHPSRLITPEQCAVELRGGGNASRQINSIVPPGFDCHRMVAVEVFTPPGNWSSYPPHKHDVHRVDASGRVLEAALEEVYFYKIDRSGGFAVQRVYTGEGSLDETVVARNDDIVLVPRGYHPVSAAPGYTVYYLNFLCGSAQSLASADDPAHAWVKGTWTTQDPRVPLVTLDMEKSIS